ncbi:MAG: HlyD family secretion protein [Rhodocyclaceae bacterium]|jgi:membrane fusion protein (multidrug efflux system)|nr:HlyD family secretion protein [Rhodocyclaceae bacterium]
MSNPSNPPESSSDELAMSAGQRLKRRLLLGVVPALFLGGVAVIYLAGGRYVETDNAYVKADKVPVSADVSATVKEVLVVENQAVVAGQPLFRLDPAAFRIAVGKAEAKLGQVRAELEALKASYREKQYEIALARTRHAFALKAQQRQADLLSKNFVSPAGFDDAKQNADLAAQQIPALEQDLKRIAETLAGNVDAPVERHPSYLAALAELEQARLDAERVEVRAALAGIVSKPPQPGQYISVGDTAMALVVSGRPWIEANFTETELTHIRPGQPATVRLDTYPGVVWKGVVDSLSPATGAEFSLIPAQNATGNWVKIAQRVPVRIRLDDASEQPPMRVGLSAVVEVDTGHRRKLLGMSW